MTLALEHSFYSGPLAVADDPRGRVRALPGLAGRLRRDRGGLDRSPPSASWTAAWTGATTGPDGPRRCSACVSSRAQPASTGRPTASPASHPSPRTRFPSPSWPARAPSTSRSPSGATTPCSAWTIPTSNRSSPGRRSGYSVVGAGSEYFRGRGPQDPLRERRAGVRLRSGQPGIRHRTGRLRGRRGAHVRSSLTRGLPLQLRPLRWATWPSQ